MNKDVQLREAKTLISLYFPRTLALMGCTGVIDVDDLKLTAVAPFSTDSLPQRTIVIEIKEDVDSDYYLSIYRESDPDITFQREIDEFGSLFVLTDVWWWIRHLFETIQKTHKVQLLPPSRIGDYFSAFKPAAGKE